MNDRIKVIDGLRGISILLVVLFHYTYQYPNKYALGEKILFQVPWGGVGVNIFFVVSGLVIMKSLEASSPIRFAISRFSRLYPTYLCCVLLTSLAIYTLGEWYSAPSQAQIWANITMLQYYIGFQSIDGVYWSLRVEVAFYAILATMFFGLRRRPFWLSLLVFSLIAFAWNTVATRVEMTGLALILPKLLVFHFFHYFVIGIVCYKILFDATFVRHPGWLLLFIRVLAIVAFLDILLNKSLTHFLATALVFAVLIIASRWPLSLAAKAMNNSIIQHLGKISYSLYLIHQVIGYIVMRALQNVGIELSLAALCTFAFSILLSNMMHRTIEIGFSNSLRCSLEKRFVQH